MAMTNMEGDSSNQTKGFEGNAQSQESMERSMLEAHTSEKTDNATTSNVFSEKEDHPRQLQPTDSRKVQEHNLSGSTTVSSSFNPEGTKPRPEDDNSEDQDDDKPENQLPDTSRSSSETDEDVHVARLLRTVTENRPSTHLEKLAQKKTSPWDHLSITLGPPVIVLFDIVVPCIIYYVWFNIHRSRWVRECSIYTDRNERCPIEKPEYDKDILGYAIISFGFGELYILVARVARLFYHRKLCAPLLSRNKWELDATSWVYAVAMLVALIPFVIGSTLEIPKLYLYSPACLMTFLAVLMVATLIPFPLPIGINSHARGTPCRPFIYYAAEDFIAVDGLQDREFRIRYNHRYDTSKPFRRLFLELTLWWILGVLIYIGAISAVIWTLEFHYAFGLTLGILFSYIIIWAITTFIWVKISMHRENLAYQKKVREEGMVPHTSDE